MADSARVGRFATDRFRLEVIRCACGYHMGVDASYIDDVLKVDIPCPACGWTIDMGEVALAIEKEKGPPPH
jgi:hypothetical protein